MQIWHLAALSPDILGGMLENSSAVGNPVAAHELKGLRGSGWSWGVCLGSCRVSAKDGPSALSL